MSNLLEPTLRKLYRQDKARLAQTQVPIVTVSASFKEDLKGWYGLPENEFLPDVVFSRAHYSMALGVAVAAWGKAATPDPLSAWIIDPTNYVSNKDWNSIRLTELIGKTLARQPLLKKIKDFIDHFGRSKLPILKSILPPLLYLTESIKQPVLSFHIAAGNILADHGKAVVQMVTDPHVRAEYLDHAENSRFWYLVFDQNTKTDIIEQATFLEKQVDPERIIVTGPPIDPRIVAARQRKRAWRSGPVNICLTTGGLGTNKAEIKSVLRQLLPQLDRAKPPFRLLVHCATQSDLYHSVSQLAATVGLPIVEFAQQPHPRSDWTLGVLYHPQIVDSNELLIKHAFPWADLIITKPSGDMAYDAAAAGCALLTLKEWGVWEQTIKEVFEQRGIARQAQSDQIATQLEALMSAQGKSQSWLETAMHQALTIDPLFLNGSSEILTAYRKIARQQH